MAICKTCGKEFSKWTTPVSAKGVCVECFRGAAATEPEAEAQDEAFPVETGPTQAYIAPALAPEAIDTPHPLAKQYSFLPRSNSKFVFILVMACFSWTLAALLGALVRAFHLPPPPARLFFLHGKPTAHVGDLLVFAPVIESLVLVGVIEVLRWMNRPIWLQIAGGALVAAVVHSTAWKPWGLIVAPGFAIDAFSYVYWRPTSRKVAFGITACIHALHNLIPAISVIAYAR